MNNLPCRFVQSSMFVSVSATHFDNTLLDYSVRRAMALQLFSNGYYSMKQATRFAGMSLESFMKLLGESGVDAVGYPADELEADLENALAATDITGVLEG